MRYVVWFKDCPEQVEFDSYYEAEHYAHMNAGCVYDREAGKTVVECEEVTE